jgi:hypothetical protein
MPVYALLKSLILLPIGVFWYFAMAIPERNFGLIRFWREGLKGDGQHLVKHARCTGSGSLVWALMPPG